MSSDISKLKGEIIIRIEGLEPESDRVIIATLSGKTFTLFHSQDCCETVRLIDYDYSFGDELPALVVDAYLAEGEGEAPEYAESFTWSFYRVVTNKGTLFMRWLGESNGHYSESVSLNIYDTEEGIHD